MLSPHRAQALIENIWRIADQDNVFFKNVWMPSTHESLGKNGIFIEPASKLLISCFVLNGALSDNVFWLW